MGHHADSRLLDDLLAKVKRGVWSIFLLGHHAQLRYMLIVLWMEDAVNAERVGMYVLSAHAKTVKDGIGDLEWRRIRLI